MTTRAALPLSLFLGLAACGGVVTNPADMSSPDLVATSTIGTVDTDAATGTDGGTDLAYVIPANAVSIKTFGAACDGTTDDHDVLVTALAAIVAKSVPLLIDCPMLVSSGTGGIDIGRPIFIDSGTQVVFSSAGEFIVDNLFIPAFVIANSSNITFTNWNVEWHGQTPIGGSTGGFWWNGKWNVVANGDAQPAGGFNNFTITEWLTKNRGIIMHDVTAIWGGGVGPMAVFFMTGDTSNVTIDGLNLHVPADATVDKFIPMAICTTVGWKSNQSVDSTTLPGGECTGAYCAMPHDLTFSNITLDGTYMGFLGGAQSSTYEHITSKRYGDLQNADFSQAGGLNAAGSKWFPPPHLFYIKAGSAPLDNNHLTMLDIHDVGPRVGVARDTAADADNLSGYADSLKLNCDDCTVDGYESTRPDGFMDTLESTNTTISNVTATYDSSFINNLYSGWRFPLSPYNSVMFKNITLTDTAKTTVKPPFGGSNPTTAPFNSNLVFDNVNIVLNAYSGSDPLIAIVGGQGNASAINYTVTSTTEKAVYATNTTVSATLEASASTVATGAQTTLSWNSTGATSCTGSWASGNIGSSGKHTATLTTAGTQSFVLTCTGGTQSTSATIPVTATP